MSDLFNRCWTPWVGHESISANWCDRRFLEAFPMLFNSTTRTLYCIHTTRVQLCTLVLSASFFKYFWVFSLALKYSDYKSSVIKKICSCAILKFCVNSNICLIAISIQIRISSLCLFYYAFCCYDFNIKVPSVFRRIAKEPFKLSPLLN